MTPTMRMVVNALKGKRFPLEDEKRTQAEMEAAFAREFELDLGGSQTLFAPPFAREVAVCGGVIDFTVGWESERVGVEVKVKGKPADISRQVRRYLADPGLVGLVLVTAKPVGLPCLIAGKPVAVFDLGRAWM